MKHKKMVIITTIVCLLPILLGLTLYNQLPDQMATHFNAQGIADGYSPKAFAVFGLPAILAVVNVICHFTVDNDPRGKNANPIMAMISKWIAPVLSIGIHVVIYMIALR